MRRDWAISAAIHATVLALILIGLATSTPLSNTAPFVIAVDVVNGEDNQVTKGVEKAKQAPPKPIADKIGEPTPPPKDPTPKVSNKPEIQATADTPPPPAPKPETKPDPKPEKAEQKPEPQVDPIAEALKRDEAKKKEEAKKLADAKKKEEAKKKAEAKKREQEKFDAASIESRLALLDKRAPQRQASAGAEINSTPTLGAATATGPTLSVNELAALQARLRDCWDVPVGVQNARDLVVTVRIQFKKDGSLAADPVVLNHSSLPLFQIAAEAATRGIRKCAPFSFMPPAKYEAWKEVEVNFDPREMFGG